VATFAIRIFQPIGTNVLNFQLCFFPQYLAAFAVGIAAGRGGWLDALARSQVARRAGWMALLAGPPALLALMALSPPPEHAEVPHFGGWHWQSFALSAWEQLAGLGLGLGMLAFGARRLDRDGPVRRWLSDRSFAVYLLHTPVLVALVPALQPVAFNPLAGAAALTLVGLLASYAVADLARRVPGLRWIL
jgi:peptidoglycan/LPS O-acetylase OafA/YrhL